MLILIIFFSNVFTVNFIQGNPDIYYAYLFCIPAILYLYLISYGNKFSYSLKFTISVFIATIFAQFSLYYIALVSLPFAVLFLFTTKKITVLAKRYVILLILVVLANLHVIYTTIKPALSAVGNVVSKQESVSSVLTEMFMLYKSIDPVNLFFFAGNSGDYSWLLFNIPGGYLFQTNPFYAFLPLQLIAVFGGCYFFLDKQKKQNKKVIDLLIGVNIIFLMFFLLILVWDNPLISSFTRNIPLTPLFRNPKKLIFSLYVVFMAFTILLSLKINYRKYSLILSSVLLINFLAIFPLISDGFNGLKKTNELGLLNQGISKNKADSYFKDIYSFPVRFLDLREELFRFDGEDPRGDYRIVVLPDNSQSLYQSYIRYIFTPFSTNGSQAIWGGLKNPEAILRALYSTILSDNSDMKEFLKITNVKYIIIDKNSPYMPYAGSDLPSIRPYYGTYTTGKPELFNSIISKKKDLKLVINNKDFYVYKNINFINNLIYTPNKLCTSDILESSMQSCDLYTDSKQEVTAKIKMKKWNKVSITKYTGNINVEKIGKGIIFFSQSFDPDWQLVSNNPSVTVEEHIIGNAFGNTWVVNFTKTGDFDFSVSFKTQPIYTFFVLISGITLVGCIGGILYLSRSNRRSYEQ